MYSCEKKIAHLEFQINSPYLKVIFFTYAKLNEWNFLDQIVKVWNIRGLNHFRLQIYMDYNIRV